MHFNRNTSSSVVGIAVVVAGVLAASSALAAPDDPKSTVAIKVNAKRTLYPIAVPIGEGDPAVAEEIAAVETFDLSVTGVFSVIAPAGYLADLKAEGMSIEPQKWKDTGAFGVIKFAVTPTEIEFRLYKVSEGKKPALTMKYRRDKDSVRMIAHRWCNAVYKLYAGEDGFFGSKIAFSTRGGGSKVVAMDFDGKNTYEVPGNSSMLPAWSPRGMLAYTAFTRNNPDLFVTTGGGRARKLSSQPGMNTGAAFSPDGSKIALTLSKDGNAEIYVISASDGAIIHRVTNHAGIDTSPAWSPDGATLAFVSDRNGGPQIFTAPASGGAATQVSTTGNYNTSPAWSPRAGKQIIAYTTRDSGGYAIAMLDLQTKALTRITQTGSNEAPSFAPNGRAIAFARVGKGVFVVPVDASIDPVMVWSGSATGVDWGPVPASLPAR